MAANPLDEGAFKEAEKKDGIRLTWNVLPSSRFEAEQLGIPLACLFTPLNESPDLQLIPYNPLVCRRETCHAVLNSLCQVNFQASLWICNFCLQSNQLPAGYVPLYRNKISSFSTVEYRIASPYLPPIFLLVVDMYRNEFSSLKGYLKMLLHILPPNALIGLVTFDEIVQVHDLTCEGISVVLKDTRNLADEEIQYKLGIGKDAEFQEATESLARTAPPECRFLQPNQKCRTILCGLIGKFEKKPVPEGRRPLRSTGVALSIAVELLERAHPYTVARIMLFVGGPCTLGPGAVAGEDLETNLSYYDAEYKEEAIKFYKNLACRAARNSHIIDIYSCSLDQVGLDKMKYCPDFTGGHIRVDNSNRNRQHSMIATFGSLFDSDPECKLKMGFEAVLEVKTSRGLKVSGAIGSCVSFCSKSNSVSDTEVGIDATSEWKFCCISPGNAVAVFFEIEDQQKPQVAEGHIQFITYYQDSSGQRRIRVTTVSRNWSSASFHISDGFDQEAAAVIMARLACFKIERVDKPDVLKFLDQTLIILCQKFGKYNKDDLVPFQLPENFSRFPEFIFHLRRSQFLQVSGRNPDETSYYRHVLNIENLSNSLIMIQPLMYAYTSTSYLEPVLFDISRIKEDRVQLIDTFLHLFIISGREFVNSVVKRVGNSIEVAPLVKAFHEDIRKIFTDRFPVPTDIWCQEDISQAVQEWKKAGFEDFPHDDERSMDEHSQGSVETAIPTDVPSFRIFMHHLSNCMIR